VIHIEREAARHVAAREALLDRCFGANRRRKTAEKLRSGRLPAAGLNLVALDVQDGLAGTVRLWHVDAGSAGPSLLLGPIAIQPELQGTGLGSALMHRALAEARTRGHDSVLLVGDAGYYARFGFRRELAAGLHLPGPYEPARFLGLELTPGRLAGATGMVVATGRPAFARRAKPLPARALAS
jgi:predicted N-acetyltransferase YhbS